MLNSWSVNGCFLSHATCFTAWQMFGRQIQKVETGFWTAVSEQPILESQKKTENEVILYFWVWKSFKPKRLTLSGPTKLHRTYLNASERVKLEEGGHTLRVKKSESRCLSYSTLSNIFRCYYLMTLTLFLVSNIKCLVDNNLPFNMDTSQYRGDLSFFFDNVFTNLPKTC